MQRAILSILLLALAPLAGCINTPAADDTTTAAVADELVPPINTIDVNHEGELGAAVFACAVVLCQGAQPVAQDRIFPYETITNQRAGIDITMSWDATSANTNELAFGVFSCSATCSGDREISAFEGTIGGSPLTFTFDDFPVADGEILFVFVNKAGFGANGVWALAATPQSFTIEGTLTPRAP